VVLLLVVAFYGIMLKANNSTKKKNNEQFLTFSIGDTLKPGLIQEKRTINIEIINGKKKITEKITKMIGDSIVEEKIIEKEEDASGNSPSFDFGNDNPHMNGFNFKQLDPTDLDSMFSMNFKQFNFDPFSNDSLMQSFGFKFGPDLKLHFGDSFMNEDFFRNFDDFFQNGMNPGIGKHFEEMLRGNKSVTPRFNNRPNENNETEGKFKSLKEIIRDQLLDDGFISDFDDSYKFDINEKKLKINGKKQDDDTFEKYKKVIEDNTGIELEDNFEYKFSNKKSFKRSLRRL